MVTRRVVCANLRIVRLNMEKEQQSAIFRWREIVEMFMYKPSVLICALEESGVRLVRDEPSDLMREESEQ